MSLKNNESALYFLLSLYTGCYTLDENMDI